MMSVKKIVAIATLSLSMLQPFPLYAGSKALGALEVTQLANNSELMAQVAEATQQTAQQINMLATMIHNLKSLNDLPQIAAQLGIPVGNLQSFINAYGSVAATQNAVMSIRESLRRLHDNSIEMATFYGALATKLGGTVIPDRQISNEEIQSALRKMNKERILRAREVLQHRLATIQGMQNDYTEQHPAPVNGYPLKH